MKVMQPKKKHLPKPVVALYIAMIVLVLAICTLVFFIMFGDVKALITGNSESEESSDYSGVVILAPESEEDSSEDEIVETSEPESSEQTSETSEPESSETTTSEPESETCETTVIYYPETEDGTGDTASYSADFFSDDLFIGDSIFTGLYLYNFLPQENVAAAVGYTPYKAMYETFSNSYSGSAVDYAASMQPKHIIIMLGSNTLAAGSDFDAIADTYEEMLNMLEKKCPDSKICVVSVPPVTADSSAARPWDIRNENIRYMNGKLEKICEKKDIAYFDLYSKLADKNGYFREKYAEQDGMHFLSNTYNVLLSGVQSALS